MMRRPSTAARSGQSDPPMIDGMGSCDTCRVNQGRRGLCIHATRTLLSAGQAPRLGYLDGDEVARSKDVYHRALDETKQGGTPFGSMPVAGDLLSARQCCFDYRCHGPERHLSDAYPAA